MPARTIPKAFPAESPRFLGNLCSVYRVPHPRRALRLAPGDRAIGGSLSMHRALVDTDRQELVEVIL
jgi:hypothetical protein